MKRGLSLLIIICMLLSLSGCSGIYSNFRELERLLVIQTMGIDFAEEAPRQLHPGEEVLPEHLLQIFPSSTDRLFRPSFP